MDKLTRVCCMQSGITSIYLLLTVLILSLAGCSRSIEDAAFDGDLEAVRQSVNDGVSVNTRSGPINGTLLSAAALSGNLDLVKFLVEKGAAVNATDDWGAVALHYAAREGHVRIVDYLLAKEAKSNICATCFDGTDYGNRDGLKGTPLHWAVAYDQLSVIKALLARGAKVDAKDQYGGTPLHAAVVRGNLASVKILVSEGANLNARTKKGLTPLHIATMNRPNGITEFLLKHGADVNVREFTGVTPLGLCEDKDTAGLLRRYGAKE